jgi:hypothetical protein
MGERILKRAPSSDTSKTVHSLSHVPSIPISRACTPCSNRTTLPSVPASRVVGGSFILRYSSVSIRMPVSCPRSETNSRSVYRSAFLFAERPRTSTSDPARSPRQTAPEFLSASRLPVPHRFVTNFERCNRWPHHRSKGSSPTSKPFGVLLPGVLPIFGLPGASNTCNSVCVRVPTRPVATCSRAASGDGEGENSVAGPAEWVHRNGAVSDLAGETLPEI